MIISRTPFRISFAGGGSDLPAYYHQSPGAVLSTSINKYMYIVIHPFFYRNQIQLKYSKTELVNSIKEISHPIFREVLSTYELSGVDINSIADIPSGTGLGSSSAFTVGLLNAARAYLYIPSSGMQLAKMACEIEIEKLGGSIGKQDQYAVAFGGLNFITFNIDDTVNVEKVIMKPEKKAELEENLHMIYIGGQHSACTILTKQSMGMSNNSKFSIQGEMVKLAHQLKKTLESNEIDNFGHILHEGWLLKKSITEGISNSFIDSVYKRGIEAGATGGKLLGAGGAGFILFYCPKERKEEFKLKMADFEEMHFNFDNTGSNIIYIGNNERR